MVATLNGFESDVIADGRNVHVIVAGYGGDMGSLTYEMAVSRAKVLKRDFPNDRVVIVGSTPQGAGPTSEFSPNSLEMNYDISVRYRSEDELKNRRNDQYPLTGDYLSSVVLNLLVPIDDRNRIQAQNPEAYKEDGVGTLRQAISNREVPTSGRIASVDFMTHSSPVSGIFLHDANQFYRPTTNQDTLLTDFLNPRGMSVNAEGNLVVTNRQQALKALSSQNLILNSMDQIVDQDGKPATLTFPVTTAEGVVRGYSVDSDGGVYRLITLDDGDRMLKAESENLSALNGLFTPDAYVNVSGCSGAYGLTEDLSKVLGVPVNGSATGSLVEVMDENGDFYYNYPASNPYGDGELSDSQFSSKGHALSPSDDRPVIGLRPDQRLYYGYWGDLRESGANFITSSCYIRSQEPEATEDRKRCEMGMARSMEDALTATNVALGQNLSFDDFTNVLIERMCPGGFSERGYISESEIEVNELSSLRQGCVAAVRSLSYLNKNCSNQDPRYVDSLFQGEVLSGQSSECIAKANQFIENHRFFVPLTDRLGQTLFCSLEGGCDVELKNCNVTDQEEGQCLSVNPDDHSPDYKACMMTKRCEIDSSQTHASNQNNPTFMRYIQNYMNGFNHLQKYRNGQLQFVTSPPGPTSTEEGTRYKHRMGQGDQSLQLDEIQNGTY